ncbi:MAG: NAD(P)-binding protein [Nonomuraea sp.]|nr:NAD(P)-binding protein [Nonomuraea sp.]
MDVIVVGAGPVGLMLACELRLHGIRTLVLDRLDAPTGLSKALNLHPRSVDTFAMRGLLDRFEDAPRLPLQHFAGMRLLDLTRTRTPHPYGLLVPQARVEEVLEKRALELGAEIRRGCAVTGLAQDESGVTVETGDGTTSRASWLAGCDGGRSTVRKLAGIAFPGTAATLAGYVGDVVVTGGTATGWVRSGSGLLLWPFIGPGGATRILTVDYGRTHDDRDAPVTIEEFGASVRRHLGGRAPEIAEAVWLSRFSDAARQAERYRAGRVFLAGDAAHVHMPFGGQGMNTGLQDAANLGWKLALAVRGRAPDGLLDTYHAERHPVAASVLENTLQQVTLGAPDDGTTRLRDLFAQLMTVPEANRLLAEDVSAVSVRYEGGGHPLVGAYMPEALRLDDGRGLLVTPDGGPAAQETAQKAARWAGRVRVTRGAAGLLVRPDGYVAWAEPCEEPLEAALTRWFGPAQASVGVSLRLFRDEDPHGDVDHPERAGDERQQQPEDADEGRGQAHLVGEPAADAGQNPVLP